MEIEDIWQPGRLRTCLTELPKTSNVILLQVDVTNRSTNVDLSNYVDNGEWELIDVRTVRRVITYACCPEPFPDVTFYLHMRRRTTYYTFNIIIPCTILSMLTIAGFFLPAESGEKVSYCFCI